MEFKDTKNNGASYKERTVDAQTNAEFLNSEFRTNYVQWYKSVWTLDYNTRVWMGFVDGKIRQNWRNYWADKSCTVMIEEYVGKDTTVARRAIEVDYRIIAEKDFSFPIHKYYVRGLFKYDKENSTSFKHIWRKIDG